jgi:hypothetical protein
MGWLAGQSYGSTLRPVYSTVSLNALLPVRTTYTLAIVPAGSTSAAVPMRANATPSALRSTPNCWLFFSEAVAQAGRTAAGPAAVKAVSSTDGGLLPSSGPARKVAAAAQAGGVGGGLEAAFRFPSETLLFGAR